MFADISRKDVSCTDVVKKSPQKVQYLSCFSRVGEKSIRFHTFCEVHWIDELLPQHWKNMSTAIKNLLITWNYRGTGKRFWRRELYIDGVKYVLLKFELFKWTVKHIISFDLLCDEELCRPRRVLSTKAIYVHPPWSALFFISYPTTSNIC